MSDYIHFEIQIEIIKNLPVKSLIRFRTVSKQWKSFIDSSEFIANYTNHEPLILTRYKYQSNQKYVSLLDNHNFHISTITPPMSVKANLDYSILVGSSHGLFCLYVYDHELEKVYDEDWETDTAVIWNLSIRKSVTVFVPDDYVISFATVVGFGVCPVTFDPMIVKVARLNNLGRGRRSSCWMIKVFTLSSRVWEIVSGGILRDTVEFEDCSVNIDGFIYWHAFEVIMMFNNFIILFDMTRREFKEICLPDSLVHKSRLDLSISKLRDSLVVLEYYKEEVAERQVCVVWMMMDDRGVPNSFKKLYTIKPGDASVRRVVGFTISGAPIIEKQKDDDEDSSTIDVYETDSQRVNEIGIYGVKGSFSVNSYTETLLMLNQPDSVSLLVEVDC